MGQIINISNFMLLLTMVIKRFLCIDILPYNCDIIMHREVLNYHGYQHISQYLGKIGQNCPKVRRGGQISKIYIIFSHNVRNGGTRKYFRHNSTQLGPMLCQNIICMLQKNNMWHLPPR